MSIGTLTRAGLIASLPLLSFGHAPDAQGAPFVTQCTANCTAADGTTQAANTYLQVISWDGATPISIQDFAVPPVVSACTAGPSCSGGNLNLVAYVSQTIYVPPVTYPGSQVFTVSGTWTNPGGNNLVEVWVAPGGSGGAGGFACGNGLVCSGSAGSGGAKMGHWIGPATSLPATVAITVGAAGAGGAVGAQGTVGGTSSFGTYAYGYAGALGAVGSVASTAAGGNNGAQTEINIAPYNGGIGGGSSNVGNAGVVGSAVYGGAGASASGGIVSGGTAGTLVANGVNYCNLTAGTPASGVNGAAGTDSMGHCIGGPGVSGGAGIGQAAGNGGAGGAPGGVGGSGGDGYNGQTRGTGGAGGPGRVTITVFPQG